MKNASGKYILILDKLKNDLSKNNITSLQKQIRTYKISNQWCTFLIKNNIVFIDEYSAYRWNDKIPVSMKLVSAFRTFISKNNKLYKIQNSKPLVDSKKVIKVQPKLIRENYKNTNKQEIGLIRKFLKWIY